MARPRGPSNPELTRQRILESAADLFARRGYASASLAEVARTAGITAPTLLYHFHSKAALFDEVARVAWRRLADELRPAFSVQGTAREVVRSLLTALTAAEQREGALATAISAAVLSDQQLGELAVQDTLLPLLSELELGIRAVAAPPIHPDAPLREVLLYIALANAAQQRLASLLESDTKIGGAEQVFMAMALFDGVLRWRPEALVVE